MSIFIAIEVTSYSSKQIKVWELLISNVQFKFNSTRLKLEYYKHTDTDGSNRNKTTK